MISLSLRLQGLQYAKDTPAAKAQLEELRDLQGAIKLNYTHCGCGLQSKLLLDFIFKGVTSALMLYQFHMLELRSPTLQDKCCDVRWIWDVGFKWWLPKIFVLSNTIQSTKD